MKYLALFVISLLFSASGPGFAESAQGKLASATVTVFESTPNGSGPSFDKTFDGMYYKDSLGRTRVDINGATTIYDPVTGFQYEFGDNIATPIKRRIPRVVFDEKGIPQVVEADQKELMSYYSKQQASASDRRAVQEKVITERFGSSVNASELLDAVQDKVKGMKPVAGPAGGKAKELGTKDVEGIRSSGYLMTREVPPYESGAEPLQYTHEVWTSKELQMEMVLKTTMSTGYVYSQQLTDVVITELNPEVFEPPLNVQWVEKQFFEQ